MQQALPNARVELRDARGQVLEADFVSTLTAAYILGKFVAPQADQQQTLDRPPGDVAAETREKVAESLPRDARPASLTTEAVLRHVDALRAGNERLEVQLRYVERLLVAGLSNLGEGLPALHVPLSAPHRLLALPDGSLYVAEEGASRIRRIDARSGVITTVAGSRPVVASALFSPPVQGGAAIAKGTPGPEAPITEPHAIAVDAQGRWWPASAARGSPASRAMRWWRPRTSPPARFAAPTTWRRRRAACCTPTEGAPCTASRTVPGAS